MVDFGKEVYLFFSCAIILQLVDRVLDIYQYPQLVLTLRVGFVISNILNLLCVLVILYRIKCKSSNNKIICQKSQFQKYGWGGLLTSLFEKRYNSGKYVTMREQHFDLAAWFSLIPNSILPVVGGILFHWLLQTLSPLIITPVIACTNLCANELFEIYILGRSGQDSEYRYLKRPWMHPTILDKLYHLKQELFNEIPNTRKKSANKMACVRAGTRTTNIPTSHEPKQLINPGVSATRYQWHWDFFGSKSASDSEADL